ERAAYISAAGEPRSLARQHALELRERRAPVGTRTDQDPELVGERAQGVRAPAVAADRPNAAVVRRLEAARVVEHLNTARGPEAEHDGLTPVVHDREAGIAHP